MTRLKLILHKFHLIWIMCCFHWRFADLFKIWSIFVFGVQWREDGLSFCYRQFVNMVSRVVHSLDKFRDIFPKCCHLWFIQEKFLIERIKVNGKVGNLGNSVSVEKSGKSKIIVNAEIAFSKRYFWFSKIRTNLELIHPTDEKYLPVGATNYLLFLAVTT